MNCPSCGMSVATNARFCPQCGTPITVRRSEMVIPGQGGAPARSANVPWKLIITLVVSFIVVITALVGGILAFVFYEIKNSEANRIAVETLKQNSAAREVLGEVESTGWPLGSFKVDGGGGGSANFSMSVKGAKAKGKYYATLLRENAVWRMTSGRLEVDGRSISIEPGAVSAPQENAPRGVQAPEASGGRTLTANRSAVADWRTVEWPEENIRFQVPADWVQESLTRREANFRAPDRMQYFTGNITYFDQKISHQSILPDMVQRAAGRLKRGEIEGYAIKPLGKVPGFLEITRRSDGATMASWNGYYDTEEFGTKSITLLVGAQNPEAFRQAEGLLGAIFESVEVK